MNARHLISIAALGAAAACASSQQFNPQQLNSLSPGMTLNQVENRLGPPVNQQMRPNGSRVVFWGGNGTTTNGGGRWGAQPNGSQPQASYALLFNRNGRFVRVLNGNGYGYGRPNGQGRYGRPAGQGTPGSGRWGHP